MMKNESPPPSPERLVFDTYLTRLKNEVGSQAYRTYWMRRPDGSTFDALGDGDNSCAYFVSCVLQNFGKLRQAHATIDSTLRDLEESEWQSAAEPEAGDIIVWEATAASDNVQHIGFYLGAAQAVSTSSLQKAVAAHAIDFGVQRPIERILRMPNW